MRKKWKLAAAAAVFALLLSGCSGMMQALADGTDTVLGGLAEGTDRVTGALADLTDNAMEAAAGATDDSAKDAILDAYGSLVDAVGSWALTPDRSLQGERVQGEVEISCSLDIEEGEAAVFLCSGLEEPMILLSESGDYSSTIEVGGGSTYIGVWGEGVAGSVSIQIE